MDNQPNNRWFKPAAIFIGILIVIGLFGNIYLLIKSPKSPIAPISQITPIPDPTANWETYTNTELGFSVKYPQETLAVKNNKFEPIEKLSNGGAPYSIFFTEYKNPANLSLQDLVAKTYNYGDEIKQKIKYSSKTIGLYIVSITEDLLSQDGSQDVFFTKDDRNYLSFSLSPYDPTQKAKTIFDQILSTFKFLNTSSDIKERFCGGIAANLPENQCPTGYDCQLDGNYPDAGGVCVKR